MPTKPMPGGLTQTSRAFPGLRFGVLGRIVGALFILLALVGVLQLRAQQEISDATARVSDELPVHLANADALASALASMSRAHASVQELVIDAGIPIAPEPEVTVNIHTELASVGVALQSLRSTSRSFTGQVDRIHTLSEAYEERAGELDAMLLEATAVTSSLSTQVEIVHQQARALDTAMADLQRSVAAEAASFQDDAHDAASSALNAFHIQWAVGTLLAGLMALYLTSMFRRSSKNVGTAVKAMATVDLPNLAEVASALGEGDLTARFEMTTRPLTDKDTGEFGDMSRHLNQAIEQLDQVGDSLSTAGESLLALVGTAKDFSQEVNAAADILATGSEEAASAAAEVSSAISGVAEGSHRQAEASDIMAQSVSRIGELMNANQELFELITKASASTNQRATAGREEAQQANVAMSEIDAAFTSVVEEVEALRDHSQEVEDITKLIRSIAEQTNLLALNAAIEAARAGETGKGFGVVAAEIKGLAEMAAGSTDEVGRVLGHMRQKVESAVAVASTGALSIRSGTETVTGAGESFTLIADSIDEIEDKITGLAERANSVTAESVTISERAFELATIAEGNSATGEEVAAASEEAASASREIGYTAGTLAAIARDLAAQLDRFHIG